MELMHEEISNRLIMVTDETLDCLLNFDQDSLEELFRGIEVEDFTFAEVNEMIKLEFDMRSGYEYDSPEVHYPCSPPKLSKWKQILEVLKR